MVMAAVMLTSVLGDDDRPGTLLLNMLIKNEAFHLERSLPKWAPLIDYWIIGVDDKNTDGSEEIIDKYLGHIPGQKVRLCVSPCLLFAASCTASPTPASSAVSACAYARVASYPLRIRETSTHRWWWRLMVWDRPGLCWSRRVSSFSQTPPTEFCQTPTLRPPLSRSISANSRWSAASTCTKSGAQRLVFLCQYSRSWKKNDLRSPAPRAFQKRVGIGKQRLGAVAKKKPFGTFAGM